MQISDSNRMPSPKNVTGKSPESSADGKDTSEASPKQPVSKVQDSTSKVAESVRAQGVASETVEDPTSKDLSKSKAADKAWTSHEKWSYNLILWMRR